jgi:hypothetical protein
MTKPATVLPFPKDRRVPSRRSPPRWRGLIAASHREAANGFKAKADAMRADYDCATCRDASPIFCNYACRFGMLLEVIERLEKANALEQSREAGGTREDASGGDAVERGAEV